MKKKILFIDNNSEYRTTMAELLAAYDLDVTEAEVISEAEHLLQHHFYHLIICDIRLEDDNQELDDSGLQFIEDPRWNYISKIVLTAYPSYERAERAFASAQGIVEKGEPAKLIQKVLEVLGQVEVNWELPIRLDQGNPFILLQVASMTNPNYEDTFHQEKTEEVHFLIRGLFPSAKLVRIRRILWSRAHRVALIAHVFATGKLPESWIVTIGPHQAQQEERNAFESYVPTTIQGKNTSSGNHHFRTLRLTAHTYQTEGGDLEHLTNLETLYKYGNHETITHTISNLFQYTLANWHKAQMEQVNLISWFDERMRIFGKNSENLDKTLKRLAKQVSTPDFSTEVTLSELHFQFQNQTIHVPNPIATLNKLRQHQILTLQATSPGHLYGDNILTDGKGSCWVTDFWNAGPAPVCRDYLSIEAGIRFDWTLLNPQISHVMEQRLTGELIYQTSTEDNPATKALNAILDIRKKIADPSALTTAYHVGIFFHAIARLLEYTEQEDDYLPGEINRLTHLMLSVGLLSDYLAREVLQEETNHTSASVESDLKIAIDEKEDRTVHINKQEFKIGKNLYKLFVFLYEKRGESCSRQELGEHVWGSGYQADKRKDITLLNTNIMRLRDKIGDDPKNPKIIKTVQSGYLMAI